MRPRFPARVYREGSEPDPRFSLANERTFLAWIRTALALLAVGVALEALEVPAQEQLRLVSAAIFVSLGILSTLQAWFGWMHAERSLRLNTALPGMSVGVVIVGGILAASGVLIVGLLW